MASDKTVPGRPQGENLRILFDALVIEMPVACARGLLTREGERRARECAWKAYDAWMGLLNEATNRFYSNPANADIAGRLLEGALRAGQVGNSLAGAAFSLIRSATGIATARQIEKLEGEVAGLREELRIAAAATQDPLQELASTPAPAAPPARSPGRDPKSGQWERGRGYRLPGIEQEEQLDVAV